MPTSLFSELRRRNVFKVALVYVVAAWLLVQFARYVIVTLGLPYWIDHLVIAMLVIGFPLALYFAYIYEITPVGLKKTIEVDQTQSIVYKTGRKLNAALAVLMVLMLSALVVSRLFPEAPIIVELGPAMEASGVDGVPAEIRSVTLDNGLEIIVWPDHDIPNVAFYYFVRAGSRNEFPGITGLSHFFEHMTFNGTSKLDPNEFDSRLEAAGGASNAYTTNDVTVYMDWFPRPALDLVFELESDRLQHLNFAPEIVEKERDVVYSERRLRIDNNNFSKLLEQVRATAYVAHPYQFPVVGWPSDIESWTRQDLVAYYETYYAPNNLTMVIAGDVTPDEVLNLAGKHLEEMSAENPPAPVRTVEPEQQGERRVIIETDARTPMLHVAFHSGRAADPETLVMTLLLRILVDGDSSRLHRILVEQEQLAISVGGFQHEGFDPGLVYFYLTLPAGGDLGLAEQRLFEELRRVVDEGVTEAELVKARNIELAEYWRGLATINGKAHALGDAAVFLGGYASLFDLPRQLEAVSIDDLRAVAGRVLRRNNATLGLLHAPPAKETE